MATDHESVPGADARPRGRLPELEGLRGLLALWVVTAHAFCWVGWADLVPTGPFRNLWLHFAHAQVAVGLFIVLSGFAIWNLLASRSQSWSVFMTGRVFRIYPVFLIALALGIVSAFFQRVLQTSLPWADDSYFPTLRSVSQSEESALASHILAHLFLLNGAIPSNWLSGSAGSIIAPAWSLSLEWQFYLVAPILFAMRRYGFVLVALAGLSLLAAPHLGQFSNPQAAFLPVQLPLFSLGIACAEIWRRTDPSQPALRLPLLIGSLAVVGGAALTRWSFPVVLLWFPLFGTAAGWWDWIRPSRWIRAPLNAGPIQWLGALSYPLYLIHWPCLILTIRMLFLIRPDWQPGPLLACLLVTYLPLSLLAAWALHRWIELPGMALGRRILERRSPTPPLTQRPQKGTSGP